MTPNKEPTTYNDAPDDFAEIMELTREEKRELLEMWRAKHPKT